MAKRIMVLASTFPARDNDDVPAFVRDQIIAIKQLRTDIDFDVLAPHDQKSNTVSYSEHPHYTEYRFHYFWPRRFEKLAGHSIMPALKENPLNYVLVPFLFFGELAATIKHVIKTRPDEIYAHWFTFQGLVAYIAGMMTRTPFVYTTHAADVEVWKKIPLIGGSVVRFANRRARRITAVSPRSMAKLEQFFAAQDWQRFKSRTSIIPMGVHMNNSESELNPSELKQRYKLGDKTVLFFMGRLAHKKGVPYLLEAFSRLNQPNLHLVIAGDGQLRSSLETQARKLNLENKVTFTGFLSGDEKHDYLNLADLMVLPSIITDDGDAEGLPVVFMEALAAGKVCVATNESGADNIIQDGVSGFLLTHKDSELLRSKIETALALDEASRQNMQLAARNTAKQFDWQVVARHHLDFFGW